MGSLSLLQQVFLTQELNQGLLHCRQILYQLNYEGSSFSHVIHIKTILYLHIKKFNRRNCDFFCQNLSWTICQNHLLDSVSWLRWILESVQFSRSVMSDSLQPHGLEHARLPCPSPTPGACANSCPSRWWWHPTISSSAIPFSSCSQSFPTSGSFPISYLFTSGGQSIGASASFSVSPSNEYSGLISFKIDSFDFLAFQGTLKILFQHHSSKHQLFGTQLSLWSNSHIHTWLLEKP